MDTAEVIASTIRLPQAAQRARVPERTLRNWVESGTLPAWRVGGRLRVKPEDVDQLAQPVVAAPKPRPATPPAPPQPLGPSVSSTEAAHRLGVKPITVRRWVEEGRLRGEKQGRNLRVEESSVAALERLRDVHVQESGGGRSWAQSH